MSSRGHDSDRGTATVELAVVFGLLLVLAIGAFEWGMAFRDWLAVTSATREGARVGSAAGPNAQADCYVLEASAGSLQSVGADQIVEVWIYETNPAGNVGARQRYRPKVPADNLVDLVCDGAWFPIQQNWQPAIRDNVGPVRDWLGVRVVFEHDWITDLFWFSGTSQWEEDTVMHLEPATN